MKNDKSNKSSKNNKNILGALLLSIGTTGCSELHRVLLEDEHFKESDFIYIETNKYKNDQSLIEPVPTYAGGKGKGDSKGDSKGEGKGSGVTGTDIGAIDIGEHNLDDIPDGVGEIGLGAISAIRAGTSGDLGKCGRQRAQDGFKVAFVWKPKSDGAFKGSVAVLPEKFLGKCPKLTITEKVADKDKVSVMRNKGNLYGREVFILDGREGNSLKKNIKLSCGCRYWIIPDPSKRVD